nr:restriction endonuclease subunit S [Porphyromonas levii]
MTTNNNPLLNCPPLRFPEFSDPWQQTTLGELLEFFPTNSLSWEQLNYSSGNIYNIHYGLIHKELPIICSPTSSKLPYINEEIETGRYCFCKSGDLVIADASEDTHDVGKAIELVDCDKVKVLAGLHTIHARSSKDKIAIGFKGYLFASNNLREQIKRVAQGTKVYSISSKLISPLKTSFPSLAEQRKIAEFLSLIDERIETQRQTIEERKKQKKALLHQIFSQSLRFPDFSDPWQQTTLGRNVVCHSSNLTEKDIETDGSIPIWGASGYVGRAEVDNPITESILIIKDGSGVGRVQYIKGKHFFLATLNSLSSKSEMVHQKFIYYFLSQFNFRQYVSGSGIPHIYFKDYSKTSLPLPSLAEQKKIAEFLSLIDERIEVEEKLLGKYEEQKRYLLRKMFV